MRAFVLAGLASMALAGCDDTTAAVVGPWKVPANDREFPHLCYVMLADPRGEGLLCSGLLDFDFVWGVEQHIRYRALDAEDALQYCSPVDADCVRVVEVEDRVTLPVGSTTTLPFPPLDRPWFLERDATSLRLDDTPVACDALCGELMTVGSGGGVFEVDVALTGDATVPLRATAVRAR